MGVPEGGVSRDWGAQAGMGFWIGVDGASIGGRGASFRQGAWLGGGARKGWASPFDASSVGTVSPGTEGESGGTEGMALLVEGKGWGIGAVSLVTFVEGDDQIQVPDGLEEIVS